MAGAERAPVAAAGDAPLAGVRVCDLKPMHIVRLRNDATADGASNRTANLIVQSLQARSLLPFAGFGVAAIFLMLLQTPRRSQLEDAVRAAEEPAA